jgi:hypothetical protein
MVFHPERSEEAQGCEANFLFILINLFGIWILPLGTQLNELM